MKPWCVSAQVPGRDLTGYKRLRKQMSFLGQEFSHILYKIHEAFVYTVHHSHYLASTGWISHWNLTFYTKWFIQGSCQMLMMWYTWYFLVMEENLCFFTQYAAKSWAAHKIQTTILQLTGESVCLSIFSVFAISCEQTWTFTRTTCDSGFNIHSTTTKSQQCIPDVTLFSW